MAQHQYDVVVVNKYGVPYGQIKNATPTRVSWELNALGDATITFPVLDSGINSGAALLAPSMIPAVREVQIWRDNVLIWWGVPVAATSDRSKVTVQCSGLLWYLKNMAFGPDANFGGALAEYLFNRQFEDGLIGWTAFGCTASVDDIAVAGQYALVDFQAARLVQAAANTDSFLSQTVTVSAGGEGLLLTLAGWYFIDPAHAFVGPAAQNRGLYMELRDNLNVLRNVRFAPITASTPIGKWQRLQTEASIPAGATGWTVNVRLYAPGGQIVWDDCRLVAPQSVGSPIGGSDIATIAANILAYVNDPTAGKWQLNIPFDTSGTSVGVVLDRQYQFSDNAVILDAFNEYPSIGACDFEVIWPTKPAETSPARKLHLYAPAKGTVKRNQVLEIGRSSFTDVSINVDGSKVRTAQRYLGQGSSGSAREMGYLAFPSYMGGKVIESDLNGVFMGNIHVVASAPFFTAADVGQPIYGLTGNDYAEGAFLPGTVIATVADSTHATISAPAINNGPALLGVGGVILDEVASGQINQGADVVNAVPLRKLRSTYQSNIIPTPKVNAEPFIGNIAVGDVVPVVIDYGWAQAPQQLLRIVGMVLYPLTEELEVHLNQVTLL